MENLTAINYFLSELKKYVNPLIEDEWRMSIPKSEMINIIAKAKEIEEKEKDKEFRTAWRMSNPNSWA